MKLTIGFSPCPNDTFIFDALVNHKIGTEGIEFEVVLADVETLNQDALRGRLDITKLSFPAFFRSLEHYVLLGAGSALGQGVGPLLISKQPIPAVESEIARHTIAIPGMNTTANLLLGFAFPFAVRKKEMLFSAIEDAVLNDDMPLGVIIHENRFTYQAKGLLKVVDLGEHWEQQMKVPIPLGGIAINQSVRRSVALKINALIRKSLEYAFSNYPVIPDYVRENSQEMDESVMRQHIDLYVNKFSLELGTEGRQAIGTLFDVFRKLNQIEDDSEVTGLFLDR